MMMVLEGCVEFRVVMVFNGVDGWLFGVLKSSGIGWMFAVLSGDGI